MSYLVLARKWRPGTFDDITGQEYITRSLKNAVSTGKTAHALLFSGPRGVGKTSSARILAKALNCKHGPTPDPCSECSFCIEIAEGKSLDVIEIDAASHTGVNDVREIIENIKYLPTSGKYKIYIVDEAHMLSQSAFNALLKTLEEPPPHVVFILATTEVHKVPVTILSRCQRHDFRKVPVEQIRARLTTITTAEGIEVGEETLYTVAREADGSMRDALSLMDQLLATFGSTIAHDDALRILGVLDRNILKSVLRAVIGKDPKAAIEALNLAMEKGIEPKRFAEDLLRGLRHALLIKACGRDAVAELPDEEKREIEETASGESVETLEVLLGQMLEGAEGVQRSFYPQTALEFTLIKLATLERTIPIESIIKRLEGLSAGASSGGARPGPAPYTREPAPGREAPSRPEPERPPEKRPATPSPHGRERETPPQRPTGKTEPSQAGLDGFIQYVKSRNSVIGTYIGRAKEVTLDGGVLTLAFESSLHADRLRNKDRYDSLREYLGEYFTEAPKVEIVEVAHSAEPAKKSARSCREEKKKKIHDDPVIKQAEQILGGRVVSVKPREKE
ncbi:MAG TPA: DNA polymerase III subunit gamma/tau [Thermodesulfobacteriota bacterium]|nr:DNA polymerase III subunit gamma/tau [Thermodesulfobacteriota bacterium]